MNLWAHTIVKNEDKYLWYAVTSVINYVDKVLLWDTGSTDNTLRIIRELEKVYPEKIIFREVADVNIDQFTVIRQKMLSETKSDWIILVDGDEVWWDDKIKEVRHIVETKGNTLDSIVSRYMNVIGDLYHYQDESAGKYKIDGKEGNFNIRAFNRNIKGLKFTKPHGQQGITDAKDILIQDRDAKRRLWVSGFSYLHFTNMQRSGRRANDLKVPKRDFKLKYEVGKSFPLDFYYPESFFCNKPEIVTNVWKKANMTYFLKAYIQTPLKKIKRRYFSSGKSGY